VTKRENKRNISKKNDYTIATTDSDVCCKRDLRDQERVLNLVDREKMMLPHSLDSLERCLVWTFETDTLRTGFEKKE
jgi:hypothetical protein